MAENSDASTTRMLFFGERALAEGFSLIGFETWPDASTQQLDQILQELWQTHTSAFVIVDQNLALSNSRLLRQIDNEGGRIVAAVVPPLARPEDFHLDIDEQVRVLLGGRPIEEP